LLSAKWFANNERSTSTAIALNFNQIGIATAFLVGGAMATSTSGLENYFGLIAVMTTLVTGK
jgi:FLVCR family feline leukemia virus subgroup C receptor-related protein